MSFLFVNCSVYVLLQGDSHVHEQVQQPSQHLGWVKCGEFDTKMRENQKKYDFGRKRQNVRRKKEKLKKLKIKNMSKNVFDEILNQNQFLNTKFEL